VNVGFGSKADIVGYKSDVGFTPNSGPGLAASDLRLSAKRRHPRCLLFLLRIAVKQNFKRIYPDGQRPMTKQRRLNAAFVSY
jgi:hypothetical protein